jgi:DNA-binding transcriptional LysR family regulator
VRALEAQGRLVRVLPDWEPPPVEVNLVHAQARLLSPRLRAFMDWAVPRLRQRLG